MGIPIEQSFQELTNHSLTDEQFSNLLKQFRKAYKELEEQTITAFPHIANVLQQLQSTFSLFVVSSKKTRRSLPQFTKASARFVFHRLDWLR